MGWSISLVYTHGRRGLLLYRFMSSAYRAGNARCHYCQQGGGSESTDTAEDATSVTLLTCLRAGRQVAGKYRVCARVLHTVHLTCDSVRQRAETVVRYAPTAVLR